MRRLSDDGSVLSPSRAAQLSLSRALPSDDLNALLQLRPEAGVEFGTDLEVLFSLSLLTQLQPHQASAAISPRGSWIEVNHLAEVADGSLQVMPVVPGDGAADVARPQGGDRARSPVRSRQGASTVSLLQTRRDRGCNRLFAFRGSKSTALEKSTRAFSKSPRSTRMLARLLNASPSRGSIAITRL